MSSSDKLGKSELSEKDVFGDIGKSAEKNEKLVEGLKKTLLDTQKILKGFSGAKTSRDINKVTEAINKSKAARAGLTAAEERSKLINSERRKSRREDIKDQLREQGVIEGTTRAVKKATIEAKRAEVQSKKLTGEFVNESARLKRLQNDYKNLLLTENKNSAAAKKLRSEITLLNAKLSDASRVTSSLGRRGRALLVSLRGLAASLGLVTGAAAIFGVFRGGIKIFKDFEEANSNLAAILDVTTESTKELQKSQKELGATTKFTASEVASLQTELAKLGFSQKEILDSTGSILELASATKSSLPDAAKLAGAAIRQFSLDTSESARVSDVFASSISKSALNMEFLAIALPKVAPVANAFGFSIEDVTALLGKLADSGFDASSAATATRNIFLNLADANGELAQSLGKPVTNLDELLTGLKELSAGLQGPAGVAKALELTDKRSVAAFATFVSGTESVRDLNNELKDSEGFAGKAAATQLDNLAGSVILLRSAYEGFILGLEDGNGTFAKTLRFIVDVTAAVFNLLTGVKDTRKELTEYDSAVKKTAERIIIFAKVIGVLISAFISYRVTVTASRVATAIWTTAVSAAKIATAFFTGGVKGATIAMKGFNLATKANIFITIISLLGAAVTAFLAFRDGANEAAEAQRNLNKAQQEGVDILNNLKKVRGENIDLSQLTQRQLKEELAVQNELIDAIEDKIAKIRSEGQGFTKAEKDKLLALEERLKTEESLTNQLGLQAQINDLLDKSRRTQLVTDKVSVGNLLDELRALKEKRDAISALIKETEAEESINKQLVDREIKRSKNLKEIKIKDLKDFADEAKRVAKQLDDDLQRRFEQSVERTKQSAQISEDAAEEILIRQRIEEDKRQARLERIKQFEQDVTQFTIEELNKRNEAVNQALNEEVQDRENQLRLEEQLAVEGRENNLAFQRQSLEEARLIRKEELEKQRRDQEAIKLAEIFLEAYLNRLSAGENAGAAAASAAVDVTTAKVAAKAIAGTISSFKEGTDDTGRVSNPLDSDGGRFALLHNDEAVYSRANRAEMKFRPRREVIDIVKNHDKQKTPVVDTGSIVDAIERMPRYQFGLNGQKEIIETIVEDKIAKVLKHRRDRLKW